MKSFRRTSFFHSMKQRKIGSMPQNLGRKSKFLNSLIFFSELYFKKVKISATALIKMVMHTKLGGDIEVMGNL